MNTKPHFVCVTEHWFDANDVSNIHLEKYHVISAYARDTKRHGGSAVLVHQNLEAEEVEALTKMSIEGQIECSAVVGRSLKTVVLCIYRPPNGTEDVFLSTLSDILNHTLNNFKNYNYVLCGDFNINLLNDSISVTNFKDLLQTFDMSQTIFEPTRITVTTATLVDNIFLNSQNTGKGQVINNALSDHEGQLLDVSLLPVPESDDIPQRKRIFSEAKRRQFKIELSQIDWAAVFLAQDVDQAYDGFFGVFFGLFNLIFPLKKLRGHKTLRTKTWITRGIKTSSKTKRNLYNKMLRREISAETYKTYTRIFKSVIKCAKTNYEKQYIQNSHCPAKAIWKLVGKYTGKTSKKNDFKIENLKHTSSQTNIDILNDINNFYLNMCSPLDIDYTTVAQNVDIHNETLYLHPLDPLELLNIIKNLRNKKSVGQDHVPVHIIKYVSAEIIPPLTYIINLMLTTGTFPTMLKTALIKPIYKKGDKNSIKNYRPIALLNNFSKIFEKVINERMVSFLEEKGLLSDFQNGFRRKKSTIRAVYQALYKILESLNSGKSTVAMCLDLSKAFDCVDHRVLLLKLEKYGIRGMANRLIESYLKDRQQCVIATDKTGSRLSSQMGVVKRGVPQGSILGPLLYILYTNELPSITPNTIQFADDTSVIFSVDSKDNECEKILSTLSVLENWFSSNNLLLNVEKTKLVKFNYQTDPIKTTYQNEVKSLETVTSATFLGIEVDHRLDWHHHTNRLAKKTASYCYALKVLSSNVDIKTAVMAYHAYVHSQLRYGIIFWARGVGADRVFLLQKRCIRNIFNLKSIESCKPKFIEAKILTLKSLYIYEAVIFIKQNMNLFQNCDRDHHHPTRHKENLKDMKCNFSYIQKNVHSSIIKIFNKIPIEVRRQDINSMKKYLKGLLVSRAYYTLEEFLQDSL